MLSEQNIIDTVKAGFACQRSFRRRTVIWPATLFVGKHEFKCMLFDVSLGGVRLKLDLPLARGAQVKIKIKSFSKIISTVAWEIDGFLGLEFNGSPEETMAILGDAVPID